MVRAPFGHDIGPVFRVRVGRVKPVCRGVQVVSGITENISKSWVNIFNHLIVIDYDNRKGREFNYMGKGNIERLLSGVGSPLRPTGGGMRW